MAYTTGTIASILPRLNADYFLPAVQREFVWKPEQVLNLVDSLLKGYPIGTLMIWQPEGGIEDDLSRYPFHVHFVRGQALSPYPDAPKACAMILDGQQRLTSLNIAFQGSYAVKDDGGAQVWIDLLKAPDLDQGQLQEDEDTAQEASLHHHLAFSAGRPNRNAGCLWMPLQDIMAVDSDAALVQLIAKQLKQLPGHGVPEKEVVSTVLTRLYRAVHVEANLAWHLEINANYDRVLEIFIRANNGGTKLTTSELCKALMTSSWRHLDAREAIRDLNEDLKKALKGDRKRALNFENMIIKSMLTLHDLGARYSLTKLTKLRLIEMENAWDDFRESLLLTAALFDSFGLKSDRLTAPNALIPVAYYVYHLRRADPAGADKLLRDNALLLQRFVMGSMAKQIFGTRADAVIDQAITILKPQREVSLDFPYHLVANGFAQMDRPIVFREADREAIFHSAEKAGPDFARIAMAYPPAQWGMRGGEIAQILPEGALSREMLEREGLSPMEVNRSLARFNGLANRCLLDSEEQAERRSMRAVDWMDTRDEAARAHHLLDGWPGLHDVRALVAFLEGRETALLDRMSQRPKDVLRAA
ncbi:DUF262 domain-containing protein [Frigidibacter sp. MR17.24]|uniref:DUF262 domain-containing protein n=1 Tax=Frigidibacter sp. MR17.24 TaxID=3127345 RepID=UPI003012DB00